QLAQSHPEVISLASHSWSLPTRNVHDSQIDTDLPRLRLSDCITTVGSALPTTVGCGGRCPPYTHSKRHQFCRSAVPTCSIISSYCAAVSVSAKRRRLCQTEWLMSNIRSATSVLVNSERPTNSMYKWISRLGRNSDVSELKPTTSLSRAGEG